VNVLIKEMPAISGVSAATAKTVPLE